MAYSHKGFNGMSQCMHHFVREHIVRGEWKHKMRPVLLNSWEAAYFDIDEEKLLNLARAGKEAGIELFVMDDGWFGNRVDDTQSLGDWQVDTNKLPHGVEGLSRKIKEMGLDFGIWVEPEMVNVKSNLYEQHPEWVLQIPETALGRTHATDSGFDKAGGTGIYYRGDEPGVLMRRDFLCKMGHEPDVHRLLFQRLTTWSAGGSRTSLCVGTVSLYENFV